MIRGVHHIAISGAPSGDYADAFARALPLEDAGLAGLMRAPNVFLAFSTDPQAKGPRRPPLPHAPGLAHLCLQSHHAAHLWNTLRDEAVVAFTTELTGLGGPFRYAYGYSRDGLMLELEETPAAMPPEAPPAWIAHAAFVTQDLNRLAQFYAGLTDCPFTEGVRLSGSRRASRIAGLTDVDMTPAWVHGLNVGLEFWRFDHPAFEAGPSTGDRSGWGYAALCLQSDDIRADSAKAEALGATISDPPLQTPLGALIRLRDPDGNALQLLEPAPDRGLDITALPYSDVLTRHARAMDAFA